MFRQLIILAIFAILATVATAQYYYPAASYYPTYGGVGYGYASYAPSYGYAYPGAYYLKK